MRKATVLGVGLFLALARPGHAADLDKHEAVVKNMIKALDDLADALESVKDRDTAKEAAVKINDVCDRLEKLGKQAEGLPKLGKEDDKRLEEKFKPELVKATQRLQKVAFTAGTNSGGQE